MARWQHAAGPYWAYVGATPLLDRPEALSSGRASLGHSTTALTTTAKRLLQIITQAADDEKLAIFVDLPPSRALPAAPALANGGFFVVPAIHRWTAAPAVLRCDVLFSQLLAYAWRVKRPLATRGVVFLLDGDRGGPKRRQQSEKPLVAFDNRYSYTSHLLPHAGFLAQQGTTGVWWVTPSEVAPDLQPYVHTLAEAGLTAEVYPWQP